jgi:hypothetical protein
MHTHVSKRTSDCHTAQTWYNKHSRRLRLNQGNPGLHAIMTEGDRGKGEGKGEVRDEDEGESLAKEVVLVLWVRKTSCSYHSSIALFASDVARVDRGGTLIVTLLLQRASQCRYALTHSPDVSSGTVSTSRV